MIRNMVIGFGRFNPVTIGHERIYNIINTNFPDDCEKYIITTTTHDNKKNPLTVEQKLRYLNKAFPNVDILVNYEGGLIGTLKQFESAEYLRIVCGEDRIKEFEERVRLYNHNLYEFTKIDFVPVPRDQYQISGTKMRQFVKDGDFKKFEQHCPTRFNKQDTIDMFNDLAKALR